MAVDPEEPWSARIDIRVVMAESWIQVGAGSRKPLSSALYSAFRERGVLDRDTVKTFDTPTPRNWLENFIYIEISNLDTEEIELAVLHRAIKRLELSAFVNVDQLRAPVKGFPGLIHFSTVGISEWIPSNGYQGNIGDNGPTTETTGVLVAGKEVLEWLFMESLQIYSQHYEIAGILEATIRFPRLTQFDRRIHFRCSNAIRKLL
ncbi:hypothetical protein BGZ91_007774 [Linnemannia elongata]|nr:hypothetical protein BGZ91_007774 [Linnemannia elongata]